MKPSLRRLFLTNLYLSAFTFGGGYVIITLMKKEFVDRFHWIDEQEMLDLVAIAQSCPGPIAVNGAIVVGYQLAGIHGLLISVLATIIPPFVILSLISLCYTAFRESFVASQLLEGMQAGVAAVIAAVVYEMALGVARDRDPANLVILAAAFFANCCLGVSVVYVVLACGGIGVARTLWRRRRGAAG